MNSVLRLTLWLVLALSLAGCTVADLNRTQPMTPYDRAQLTPATPTLRDLVRLPEPQGRIVASVYGFRDMTGQYKAAPDSAYSTAVTQGAGAMLTKAMLDSHWFLPVEREGLQNLLTERRIVRGGGEQDKTNSNLPDLTPAGILLEGGIVSYETDVRTGGFGLRYFGAGVSDQYRTDQVTVNLRAVDTRTGRVLASVNTTKTVYSKKMDSDVYRFIRFKELLEYEAGYTRNEPVQLCVQDAIEAALVHLIVTGLREKLWALKNPEDMKSPIIQEYLKAQETLGAT